MTNQDKLDEMYDKVDEIYDIVRGMRNRERISNIMKVLYWVVIIGAAFGAYYYVKPVVDTVVPKIESVQKGIDQINNVGKQLNGVSESLPEVGTVKNIIQNIKDKYSSLGSSTSTAR